MQAQHGTPESPTVLLHNLILSKRKQNTHREVVQTVPSHLIIYGVLLESSGPLHLSIKPFSDISNISH